MKLNIDALRAALAQPKTAIHCDTEEKAATLFEAMGWGEIEHRYKYGCTTCFQARNSGDFSCYGERVDFEDDNFTILTLDDYILPDEPLICKALGVDVGQEFRFDWPAYSENIYHVDGYGRIKFQLPHGGSWLTPTTDESLSAMINNPHLIRIIPRWTEDDIADADAVMRIFPDYKWVARDKDGVACAYVKEPTKKNGAFYPSGCFCFLPSATAFPSVTWENSPIKLEEIK